MTQPDIPDHDPFNQLITWSVLLARWTEFAKSAVALPTTGEAGRWRDAVTTVIGLQAVTQALAALEALDDPTERPVALDRAEVMIRQHAADAHKIWAGEPLPVEMAEIIDDARRALRLAPLIGASWTVAGDAYIGDHPAELAAALHTFAFDGYLFTPSPGIPLFKGSPVAHCRDPHGGAPPDEVIEVVSAFLETGEGDVARPDFGQPLKQVYREFDFAAGGPVRDVIRLMDDELPAGQPLLVLAFEAGRACAVSMPPRSPQLLDPLPVVDLTAGEPEDGLG